MIKRSARSRQYGQWTLIGLLVTICIIGILAALYIPQIAARHSAPGQAATPMERAYGTACVAYLEQMNEAVTMYKSANDDHAPTSINDLKPYGVTDDMIYAEGCHFSIDPATGDVVESGHGKFHGRRNWKVRGGGYIEVGGPGESYGGPSQPSTAPGQTPGGPGQARAAHHSSWQPNPGSSQPANDGTDQNGDSGDTGGDGGGGGTTGPGGIKIPNIPTADPGL